MNILHIDSSPRGAESVSKKLTAALVERLEIKNSDAVVTYKDLSEGVPYVDGLTLTGYWTPEAEHSPEVKAAVAPSNKAISELIDADVLVMGVPLWNFSVPASVKAWVDLIVRGGLTFKQTEGGYEGLLPKGKKAYVIVASGGVPIGSDYDMASTYITHILGFVGITDVEIIAAGQQMMPNGAEELKKAEDKIATL